jgi:hypothetical protein
MVRELIFSDSLHEPSFIRAGLDILRALGETETRGPLYKHHNNIFYDTKNVAKKYLLDFLMVT